jgi:ribonucleoside-diphosphate reductase alpha chain
MASDPPSVPSAAHFAASLEQEAGRLPMGYAASDAPLCMQCGVRMQRAGSCHACPSCGSTSGCS